MPSTEPSLGEKLRYFRKDRGYSQTMLELQGNLSYGTISRIEKGTVNPTKETLLKIALILDLSDQDVAYLLKLQNSTPTIDEITRVISSINEDLNSEIFPAYLIDNKFRICAYNEMIRLLLEIPIEEAKDFLYMNVTNFFFLSKFNIRKRIPVKYLLKVVKEQVKVFFHLAKRYREEADIKNDLQELKTDKQFRTIWNSNDKTIADPLLNNVDFYLKYQRQVLSMTINRAQVLSDSRFLLVTYFPRDLETATIFEQIREKVGKVSD